MARFLSADAEPIKNKRRSVFTELMNVVSEPKRHVEGEVDRIELDMRECMEERDPSFNTAKASARY